MPRKTCEGCGVRFTAHHSKQRFHSRPCCGEWRRTHGARQLERAGRRGGRARAANIRAAQLRRVTQRLGDQATLVDGYRLGRRDERVAGYASGYKAGFNVGYREGHRNATRELSTLAVTRRQP